MVRASLRTYRARFHLERLDATASRFKDRLVFGPHTVQDGSISGQCFGEPSGLACLQLFCGFIEFAELGKAEG